MKLGENYTREWTDAYEVMKFMTHDCQRKKVSDGEMAYYENEDVGWQGKEEEHFTCMALKPWPRFVCFLKWIN